MFFQYLKHSKTYVVTVLRFQKAAVYIEMGR